MVGDSKMKTKKILAASLASIILISAFVVIGKSIGQDGENSLRIHVDKNVVYENEKFTVNVSDQSDKPVCAHIRFIAIVPNGTAVLIDEIDGSSATFAAPFIAYPNVTGFLEVYNTTFGYCNFTITILDTELIILVEKQVDEKSTFPVYVVNQNGVDVNATVRFYINDFGLGLYKDCEKLVLTNNKGKEITLYEYDVQQGSHVTFTAPEVPDDYGIPYFEGMIVASNESSYDFNLTVISIMNLEKSDMDADTGGYYRSGSSGYYPPDSGNCANGGSGYSLPNDEDLHYGVINGEKQVFGRLVNVDGIEYLSVISDDGNGGTHVEGQCAFNNAAIAGENRQLLIPAGKALYMFDIIQESSSEKVLENVQAEFLGSFEYRGPMMEESGRAYVFQLTDENGNPFPIAEKLKITGENGSIDSIEAENIAAGAEIDFEDGGTYLIIAGSEKFLITGDGEKIRCDVVGGSFMIRPEDGKTVFMVDGDSSFTSRDTENGGVILSGNVNGSARAVFVDEKGDITSGAVVGINGDITFANPYIDVDEEGITVTADETALDNSIVGVTYENQGVEGIFDGNISHADATNVYGIMRNDSFSAGAGKINATIEEGVAFVGFKDDTGDITNGIRLNIDGNVKGTNISVDMTQDGIAGKAGHIALDNSTITPFIFTVSNERGLFSASISHADITNASGRITNDRFVVGADKIKLDKTNVQTGLCGPASQFILEGSINSPYIEADRDGLRGHTRVIDVNVKPNEQSKWSAGVTASETDFNVNTNGSKQNLNLYDTTIDPHKEGLGHRLIDPLKYHDSKISIEHDGDEGITTYTAEDGTLKWKDWTLLDNVNGYAKFGNGTGLLNHGYLPDVNVNFTGRRGNEWNVQWGDNSGVLGLGLLPTIKKSGSSQSGGFHWYPVSSRSGWHFGKYCKRSSSSSTNSCSGWYLGKYLGGSVSSSSSGGHSHDSWYHGKYIRQWRSSSGSSSYSSSSSSSSSSSHWYPGKYLGGGSGSSGWHFGKYCKRSSGSSSTSSGHSSSSSASSYTYSTGTISTHSNYPSHSSSSSSNSNSGSSSWKPGTLFNKIKSYFNR